MLREYIVHAIDANITSICETHLAGQNVIPVDSYSWIGFYRHDIHRNAPKASGGVGLLIKSWMFEAYDITVSFEGILAVKFVHKETDRDFVVLSCYLRPENSTRG